MRKKLNQILLLHDTYGLERVICCVMTVDVIKRILLFVHSVYFRFLPWNSNFLEYFLEELVFVISMVEYHGIRCFLVFIFHFQLDEKHWTNIRKLRLIILVNLVLVMRKIPENELEARSFTLEEKGV